MQDPELTPTSRQNFGDPPRRSIGLHQLLMNEVFALIYPGSGRMKAKKIRPAFLLVLEFLL